MIGWVGGVPVAKELMGFYRIYNALASCNAPGFRMARGQIVNISSLEATVYPASYKKRGKRNGCHIAAADECQVFSIM